MNTANYVYQQIKKLKDGSLPLMEAAWQAAKLCIGWPYIFGDRGQYCTPGQRRIVYNKHQDQTGLVTQCQVLSDKSSVCNGCKWYPSGLRVRSFDCRGFTYWILLQIYGWELMGSGCTAQWNNEANWKAKGTIDTIPEDTLVCLFYKDKKTPSKMGHTGFGYNGETIECSAGVQYTKKRNAKWQYWAIPACVEKDAPAPDPDRKPMLRKGDKGTYVKELQTDLHELGYDLGKYGIDGSFGAVTEKAVKKFQEEHGLNDDGVVGKETWKALQDAIDGKPALYTVTIPNLTKEKAEAICKEWSGAEMKKQ